MYAFRDRFNALPAFPLPENYYLKRSEIFGPKLEKHFRIGYPNGYGASYWTRGKKFIFNYASAFSRGVSPSRESAVTASPLRWAVQSP